MTVSLLPDVEALVCTYLRAQPEVSALVAARVGTEVPEGPTFPLVRVRRIAGAPVLNVPLYLDAPVLQIEGYASNKATARALTETVRAVMAERMIGNRTGGGVVSKVTFGSMSWLPDEDFTPPQPRYIADVTVYVHQ